VVERDEGAALLMESWAVHHNTSVLETLPLIQLPIGNATLFNWRIMMSNNRLGTDVRKTPAAQPER
jgi:hypothetical protein